MISTSVHASGRAAWVLSLAACPVFVAFYLWAHSSTGPGNSAKEVVELFRKMDSQGERLTNKGWLKVAALFVRPEPPPREVSFTVVTNALVGQEVAAGNRAEVWTECTEWGTIDAVARFRARLSQDVSIGGSIKHVESSLTVRQPYKVVFTDSYWELTREGGPPKEAKGPAVWRIETFEPTRHVAMDTAIQYLTALSGTSSDPVIRQNAGKSIAAIKRLYRSRAGMTL